MAKIAYWNFDMRQVFGEQMNEAPFIPKRVYELVLVFPFCNFSTCRESTSSSLKFSRRLNDRNYLYNCCCCWSQFEM